MNPGDTEFAVNLCFNLNARILNRYLSGDVIRKILRLAVILKLITVPILMRMTFTLWCNVLRSELRNFHSSYF